MPANRRCWAFGLIQPARKEAARQHWTALHRAGSRAANPAGCFPTVAVPPAAARAMALAPVYRFRQDRSTRMAVVRHRRLAMVPAGNRAANRGAQPVRWFARAWVLAPGYPSSWEHPLPMQARRRWYHAANRAGPRWMAVRQAQPARLLRSQRRDHSRHAGAAGAAHRAARAADCYSRRMGRGSPKCSISTANRIFDPCSPDDRLWTMDNARPSIVYRQKREHFYDSMHLPIKVGLVESK